MLARLQFSSSFCSKSKNYTDQFGIRISDEDRESLINIPVIRFFAFSFDDLNLLCDKFHYLFSGQKSVKMILF